MMESENGQTKLRFYQHAERSGEGCPAGQAARTEVLNPQVKTQMDPLKETTDAPDDFAAGLEVPVPGSAAPDVNNILEWARSEFDGLPEDMTADRFANDIIDWRTKAAEAEELRKKVAEYEAANAVQYQANQAQEAAKAQAAAQAQAAQQPERPKRRFEPIRMEDAERQLLSADYAEFDEKLGLYKPKVMVPQVMNAVDRQNRALRQRHEIAEAMTADPYAFLDEGVIHTTAYQKLAEELATLRKQLDERVQPLQKTAEDLAEARFLNQNATVLFQPSPTNPAEQVYSAAGEMFSMLVDGGMARDKALEMAKTMSQKFAAPAPVAPASPALAAQAAPAPAPAKRFNESIIKRRSNAGNRPAERRPGEGMEVASDEFRTTWSSINAAVKELADA